MCRIATEMLQIAASEESSILTDCSELTSWKRWHPNEPQRHGKSSAVWGGDETEAQGKGKMGAWASRPGSARESLVPSNWIIQLGNCWNYNWESQMLKESRLRGWVVLGVLGTQMAQLDGDRGHWKGIMGGRHRGPKQGRYTNIMKYPSFQALLLLWGSPGYDHHLWGEGTNCEPSSSATRNWGKVLLTLGCR